MPTLNTILCIPAARMTHQAIRTAGLTHYSISYTQTIIFYILMVSNDFQRLQELSESPPYQIFHT